MYSLLEKLQELNYSGLKRKQRSIARLFPTFADRVKDVGNKGGVRLSDTKLGLWHFKVHSGTKASVWYDIYVKFKDVESLLDDLVKNRKLWKDDKSSVDLRKLAHAFLYKADLQLKCSCPAFLYWGAAYILSKGRYDAKYTDPETRPPRIRNPKQYGAYCKHLEAVMKVLPFYDSTMAKYLSEHYSKVIETYEEAARREFGWIKKVAVKLAKRKEEEEELEKEAGEEEEPKKEVPHKKKILRKKKEIPSEEEEEEEEKVPHKKKILRKKKEVRPEEEPEEEEEAEEEEEEEKVPHKKKILRKKKEIPSEEEGEEEEEEI